MNSVSRAADHRLKHRIKARKKYTHCERKMARDKDMNDFGDIPDKAWALLQGVNIFQDEKVVPEDTAEPMICSPSISISKAELAFLKKGPRFMLRQEVDECEFRVDLEKMMLEVF